MYKKNASLLRTMQLLSLQLENIRSYVDQKIEFSKGRTLLQGDIGSGKSTVLLAIEFALFGLLRGTLTGSTLLRHGQRRGSVTLEFKVGERHIFIKRSLKRSKTSVDQDEGIFIDNGAFHNLTPTELKVKVLDLLGYSADLLTKSKSLIYRYTVYTPQEQMKRILAEKPETRINILRKVFDIDKYKRIQDNLAPYTRSLREQQKECEGYISDLHEKLTQFTQRTAELQECSQKLKQAKNDLAKIKAIVKHKADEMGVLQKEMADQQSIANRLAMLTTQVQSRGQLIEELELRTQAIDKELEQVTPADPQQGKDLQAKREESEQKLANARQELQEIHTRMSVCESHITQSRKLKGKIAGLTKCPTCLQHVTASHKQVIDTKETEKITRMEVKKDEFTTSTRDISQRIREFEESIAALRKQEQEHLLISARHDHFKRLRAEREAIAARISTLQNEDEQQSKTIEQLSAQQKPGIHEKHARATREYERLTSEAHQNDVLVAQLSEQHSFLKSSLESLQTEIEKKKKTKARLQTLKRSHDWLTQHFTPLIATMEKHVLTRIYHGFNDMFVTWFNELVQDEVFSARLDDQFTPIIEQNGYETSFDNLSGGEKTACALAYRLALTKVINSLMTSIKTDNLLILDEPTDGFSSEQLDRMREVLEHLGLGQVIIVSHEHKMESFVDHVIHVHKQENISRVA